MSKEAMKLALEALDEFCELGAIIRPLEVRDALREALASEAIEQPAQQEPVAYIHRQGNHYEVSEHFLSEDEKSRGWTEEPLYTSPPAQRKPWVGLTDVEWQEIDASLNGKRDLARIFVRAIEAKLKEKNT